MVVVIADPLLHKYPGISNIDAGAHRMREKTVLLHNLRESAGQA